MQAYLESAPTVVSSMLPVIMKVVRCPQCNEKMLPSALFWHQTLEHHQHVVDRAARSVLDNGEDTSGPGDVQLVSSPLLPTEGEAVVTLPDPTADKVDTTTSDKPGPVVVQPVSPVSLPTDTQENQGEDAVNHSDRTTDEAAVNSSEDVLEILPDRKMSFQYCGQWAGDILLQPTVPSNAIARFVLCNTSLFQARQEWPDVDTWLVLSLITQINQVRKNLDSLSDNLPYSLRRRGTGEQDNVKLKSKKVDHSSSVPASTSPPTSTHSDTAPTTTASPPALPPPRDEGSNTEVLQ